MSESRSGEQRGSADTAGAGYVIRAYEPGDEDGILASFNRVFGEVCGEGYVDRDRSTWAWTYEQNPAGARIFVALAPDGTVAGHYGGIPQLVRTPEGDRVIVHAVDSYVVAEHRRGLERPGLFVNTAQPWFADCENRGDAMIYGYPVTKAMRIGQRYLGYTPMRRLDYLVRPTDAGALAQSSTVAITEVAEIPGEIDTLQREALPAHSLAVVRDRRYLDWRYARSPDRVGRNYRFFAARRRDELVGFAIAADALLIPDHSALIDVVVPESDEDALAGLIGEVVEHARGRGKAGVMTVLPPWWRGVAWLIEHAGFETRSSGDWMERTLSHRSFDRTWSTDWLRDHWFYTLGDSDLA